MDPDCVPQKVRKIKIDVLVPVNFSAGIKVFHLSGKEWGWDTVIDEGIYGFFNPEKPNDIVIQIMMEDLYFNDFEYNAIEDETIEQPVILIDDKIIEILPDYRGMDVVYDWFEIDTKCRIKFCNNYWADLGLRCT